MEGGGVLGGVWEGGGGRPPAHRAGGLVARFAASFGAVLILGSVHFIASDQHWSASDCMHSENPQHHWVFWSWQSDTVGYAEQG